MNHYTLHFFSVTKLLCNITPLSKKMEKLIIKIIIKSEMTEIIYIYIYIYIYILYIYDMLYILYI